MREPDPVPFGVGSGVFSSYPLVKRRSEQVAMMREFRRWLGGATVPPVTSPRRRDRPLPLSGVAVIVSHACREDLPGLTPAGGQPGETSAQPAMSALARIGASASSAM